MVPAGLEPAKDKRDTFQIVLPGKIREIYYLYTLLINA